MYAAGISSVKHAGTRKDSRIWGSYCWNLESGRVGQQLSCAERNIWYVVTNILVVTKAFSRVYNILLGHSSAEACRRLTMVASYRSWLSHTSTSVWYKRRIIMSGCLRVCAGHAAWKNQAARMSGAPNHTSWVKELLVVPNSVLELLTGAISQSWLPLKTTLVTLIQGGGIPWYCRQWWTTNFG